MMPEQAKYRIIPTSGNIRYYIEKRDVDFAWEFVLGFKYLPGVSAKLQVLNDDGVWETIDGFGWFAEL